MSNRNNDILKDLAAENVYKAIEDGNIEMTPHQIALLIKQEYERLMEREE